jgi:hypothetical protein
MTILTVLSQTKNEDKGPDSELLVSKDVEKGTPFVATMTANRQQLISLIERRRRRLRCVLLLTSMMTLGTAALAIFYLVQFLYTYHHAMHFQCQFQLQEPSELQNAARRVYPEMALAGPSAYRGSMDVEMRARPNPPGYDGRRLLGRPDGHDGGLQQKPSSRGDAGVPVIADEYFDDFSFGLDEDDSVEGDKKHHHKKMTTTRPQPHVGELTQERVDVIDDQHVRLEVPQLATLRSATVFHDFTTKWTAFYDSANQRCYVKPLAKTMAAPPRDLVDLLYKLESDFYMPNVEAIRVQYRVLPNPKTPTEMSRFGNFIARLCQDVPTQELIPIISNSNNRRRRSSESQSHVHLNFGMAGTMDGHGVVEVADLLFYTA